MSFEGMLDHFPLACGQNAPARSLQNSARCLCRSGLHRRGAFQQVCKPFPLAFTFSFDDFIIAFFVAGSKTTLPIYVFSSIRRGVTPEINAIGSMVLGVSLVLLITAQLILRRGAPKA